MSNTVCLYMFHCMPLEETLKALAVHLPPLLTALTLLRKGINTCQSKAHRESAFGKN